MRPYEPSMEEILASIRRIIADDQSMPRQEASDPAPGTAAVHMLRDAPTHTEISEPSVDMMSTRPEPEETAMGSHGTLAAFDHAIPEALLAVPAVGPQGSGGPARGGAPAVANEPASTAAEAGDAGDYFDPPHEYDRPTAAQPGAPLFSPTTNSSVSSAFKVLAATRLADNSDELLGMAREMIRPLLRAWLDENLPTMVERLVREEIERVARGGR